ncbi:MdtA/MuxA family multidrug efflux RND transporter periplasmic adaptor subunit [Amantichitinum ursilacus]|uniref:Multidrug resistance protein MdtA n=1 Tax=Amantichitinum ursilacus TaxID=857265 RepID=A0A0N0GLD8_9NEIS|nr:MdtA/MuxA family multidrug efflux RND transporter periplasmic adaptor subunit [Amantichitinum ursilacus]KPC49894.1 Multidrug resistance protein MdtA precursor [Amantichitinum ursilacus]
MSENQQPVVTPPAHLKRKRTTWPYWVAAVVIVAGGVYFIKHAQTAPSANAGGGRRAMMGAGAGPMPVHARPVRKGDLNIYLNGLGTVTPANSVTVHTRVDGLLQKVFFTEGQMVKEGQVLAQIDPAPFAVAVAQAEGQLARDKAQLASAQQDAARYQTLVTQDSISKQTADQQAALVQQYAGTVKADQAAVDSAKLQLSYTRVTAPASGRVGLRQVDPGNMVHSADTNGLVVINQVTPVSVLFTIPEGNLPAVMKQLQAGQKLAVDAFDRTQTTQLAKGTLLTIDNQIDTTTGTVKLKATFPNEDGSLFPNQFVNARLLVETKHDATFMPSAAVQRGSSGTFVFAVGEDKTVSAVPVTLGAIDGDKQEVVKGVHPGDVVVIDGGDKLKDGGQVEVVAANASEVAAKPRGRRGSGPHGKRASGAWQHRPSSDQQ